MRGDPQRFRVVMVAHRAARDQELRSARPRVIAPTFQPARANSLNWPYRDAVPRSGEAQQAARPMAENANRSRARPRRPMAGDRDA